jgi:hypothetical protein
MMFPLMSMLPVVGSPVENPLPIPTMFKNVPESERICSPPAAVTNVDVLRR